MLKTLLLSILLATNIHYFPPVDYEISLAGNFGEPRPNHFHGGIDVKTDGVEGKHIYAIADGYVSRITVGYYGFGNAVYVTHPDGYTSVYCHLKSFSPRIKHLLRQWQYQHRSYIADVRLNALQCPVSQGQLIAVSGNTGSSQAPHLHMEIHDTYTWNMVDPLDFLADSVTDGMPPMAHGMMVYPQQGEGVFCGGSSKQTYGFGSHNLSRKFTAWGKVGFGVWANDYMEITYNRYGVRETILTVDGREVFHSNVTDIPVNDNRMVNSWGDYEHYCRYGVWYLKSFIEPGNTLPILWADKNRGIVDFNQERDYHLMYTLRDFKGNSSFYTFTVRGVKQRLPQKHTAKPMLLMKWNKTNTYVRPGMQLVIPYGLLGDDVELQPAVRQIPGALSPAYSYYHSSYPLFNWAEISIAATKKVPHPDKLYIACNNGANHYNGGVYKDGWVTGRMRELGATYTLAYDATAPAINPVGQASWNSTKVIRIGLSDAGSGIKSYSATVDGKFVLFERVPKSPWVMCRLKETPLNPTGQLHTLRFTAVDNRDNQRVFTAKIKY